uniref:Uncharacterized protein n=1 Tax=Rhizophora mucronata TaxID=61149 RepID=A0A2P2ILQ4_RHIMU
MCLPSIKIWQVFAMTIAGRSFRQQLIVRLGHHLQRALTCFQFTGLRVERSEYLYIES